MFATAITSKTFIFNLVKLKYSFSPSLALPHWTLCVCMCLCMFVLLICEGVSVLFFQMTLFCRTQDIFYFCLKKCAFLLPCALQPITFNLSLCGIPAVPTVPPFSCRCTLMTGVLWPLLCRQCHFLSGISRHLSTDLRQWCLHSVIYSTWTPNSTYPTVSLFFSSYKCTSILISCH